MAASPSQQQYFSPSLGPYKPSTLSTDMIDSAFYHIGGLSTSGIAPIEWEHCHYSPPILHHGDTTDALFDYDHGKAASGVHLQHGEGEELVVKKERKVGKDLKRRKPQEHSSGGVIGKKDEEEGPFGHIHVRARRGQATDTHSLAERVRREKINERMKKLQGLVPGCDKVSGRALLLDEIINYVQSLQNQVEFLSMKLASSHSMQNYTFNDQKFENMSYPSVQSFSQPTAFAAPEINSHILDVSPQGFFLQREIRQPSFPHSGFDIDMK